MASDISTSTPPIEESPIFKDKLGGSTVPSVPLHASDEDRMALLGVDLTQYSAIEERENLRPIVSRKNRNIQWPILRTFMNNATQTVPDPLMLTHIVTTRCNYSCEFCCFADSLNAKTNDLTLEEIDHTYQTMGGNLNVIVYSGGETTLNKNLADIVESAYRNTPVKSVYIISNAWKPNLIFQITHQIKQRCPGLHLTWSLSIEGPKEHNNGVRYTKKPGWDAWQNTIDTLFGLKAMRQRFGYDELDVQLCTVCTPDNVDLMDDWYLMVRDVLQPDKWNLNLMRRSVQMSESDLETFSERRDQRELEAFEEKYLAVTERVRKDVILGRLKFLYHTEKTGDGAMKSAVDLISQAENRRVVRQEAPKFCCKAGTSGAFIGSEGDVSGCEEFAQNMSDQKIYGNLRDVNCNFQALWRSPKANQLRNYVNHARECEGCTLESQKNYPAILVSFKTLLEARSLSKQIKV